MKKVIKKRSHFDIPLYLHLNVYPEEVFSPTIKNWARKNLPSEFFYPPANHEFIIRNEEVIRFTPQAGIRLQVR